MALPSIIFGLLLVWLLIRLAKVGKRAKTLPPGPPTIPLLGNALIYPKENAHHRFTEWSKTYGDIFSLKIANKTVVVLSSVSAVKDLLDKRSATTGSRPSNHMVNTITDGYHLAMAPFHSEIWRLGRKIANTILTPQATERLFIPIQKAEGIQLLHDILSKPSGFYTHIRRYSYSSILSVVYGKRVPRDSTYEMKVFFEALSIWENVLDPSAHPPVDLLPFLKYVPERWAPWKRLCSRARYLQRGLYLGLVDECEKRIQRNEENGCYIETILQRQRELGIDREAIAWIGGVLLEGASDTTSAFLQSLILLLTAFPDAQQKAQEEMERVVGSHRIPQLSDFDELPYIQAIIKETHRFRPAAPVAIPHALTTDEEFRGHVLPQDTIVFMNTWGIFHDPEIFDQPDTFDPGRFILSPHGVKRGVDDSDFNRPNMVFGAGRRICLGMHIANKALQLTAMFLIWAFEFRPVQRTDGTDIPVDINNYHKGMAGTPHPFACRIEPRNASIATIIEQEFAEATSTFTQFEHDLDLLEKEWLSASRK
ncbi:cytochrome P450 [Mycena floridula]|nr:cytochrome P450 [Mycena floridula]